MKNPKQISISMFLALVISISLIFVNVQLLREAITLPASIILSNGDRTQYQRELFFVLDLFNFRRKDSISALKTYFPSIEDNYIKNINGDCKKFYNLHSHNDYWRQEPFFGAISRNYRSIEADVWYYKTDMNQELYVGHNEYVLSKYKTLRSMYLEPLLEILDDINNYSSAANNTKGVYYNFPNKYVNLLIDIKNKFSFPIILQQLKPLDKYLSYYDYNLNKTIERQIVVTLTGDIPIRDLLEFDAYLARQRLKRYVFIDYSMFGSIELENRLDLGNWSFLSSISYEEFSRLSGDFPKNSTKFSRILNHSNIAGLKKLTNKHNVPNTNCSNSKIFHVADTRIWGVPQFHHDGGNGFFGLIMNYFRTLLSKSESVDVNIWKDLVINGGISMMNVDNLDFGIDVFNNIYNDL